MSKTITNDTIFIFSTTTNRNGAEDAVVDPGVLLKEHVDSQPPHLEIKTLLIRMSRPYRSFVSELKSLKLVETDNIEVKFKDSLNTVDDQGVRRDFFQRLFIDIAWTSGLLDSVGENIFILSHNAEKLENAHYYVLGWAMAASLTFGGPAPTFFSPAVYDAITRSYDVVQPEISEIPEEYRDIF